MEIKNGYSSRINKAQYPNSNFFQKGLFLFFPRAISYSKIELFIKINLTHLRFLK